MSMRCSRARLSSPATACASPSSSSWRAPMRHSGRSDTSAISPTEATTLANRESVNPEAHLEYLKSRHSFYAGSREAMEVALRYARRALELDPTSALAWTALANCQIFRAIRGIDPPIEAAAA